MKKLIIIGGGITGLTAGIYGQMKGFNTEVIEKHSISGGNCTGWNRDEFHIDGCIHWLVGTKEGTYMNKLWREVGALKDIEIYNPESFQVYNYKGQRICLYRDLQKMKKHFLEISPEDKDPIEEFCNAVKILQDFGDAEDKPLDLMNPIEIFKSFMGMKNQGSIMNKYGKVTVKEFGNKFKHQGLREMISQFGSEEFSIALIFFALGNFTAGNAGIPMGGSREFSFRVEKKYKELGGVIRKNSQVTEVIVENGQAKGIVLESGEKIYGDYIISTCDPYITFNKLLKGKYSDKKLDMRYKDPANYPIASNIYVSLAVDYDMRNHPRTEWIDIDNLKINNTNFNKLPLTNYSYDESFAPKGKTVLICPINQFNAEDYNYWQELYKDKEEYNNEKMRIAKKILEGMEKTYDELKGKLKILDVATPVTFNRYTGGYLGSFMAFFLTTNSKMIFYHNNKVKGLKNFYLSGQWINPPGGLPTALITGKETIQRICKREKIKW